ncbi:MAG TPA: DNA replication/repair protein RecF [Firmicutes bacterium]|nr:DNA replication/repair protein RecF [Bacillota bacterium]
MFLEYISLQNFRNYRQQEVSFNTALNLLVGENAQGKTNLLEAVYYLLTCRSFRTETDREMAAWESGSFYLKGAVQQQAGRKLAEIGFQTPSKLQIKINGAVVQKRSHLFRFPVVFFGPDDLCLVKEGPAIRRRYLDLVGSRAEPQYYRILKDYHRVLRQRNRVIKEKRFTVSFKKNLEIWNEPLVGLGSKLIKQRISLLNRLGVWCKELFFNLYSKSQVLTLQYMCTVDHHGDLDNLAGHFYRQLCLKQAEEEIRGYTLLGPHLDDFNISLNHRLAKVYSSQGQQRVAALALKIGEIQLLEFISQEKPVLLLDDVFSELDFERRGQLLNFLKNKGMQTVITTVVPLEQLLPSRDNPGRIFSVREGRVVETAP